MGALRGCAGIFEKVALKRHLAVDVGTKYLARPREAVEVMMMTRIFIKSVSEDHSY